MRTLSILALLAFQVSMTASASVDRSKYPDHWWAAVPKEGAPAWEVLPQEAGPDEVILSKRHELGLMSNFAATPFIFEGKHYASLEGFWQAMLFPENERDPRARAAGITWKHTRAQVEQMVAFEAKRAGDEAFDNMRKMGIDWVSYRGKRFVYWTAEKGEQYKLIVAATRAKVAQNPEVRKALLSTRGLKLRPDHRQPADAPPSWRYFDILTEIREQL